MKLAIIGNGNIVKAALVALQEIEQIEVSAICVREQSRQKGEALQQQFSIPLLYTDYDALLDNPEIDFVYIGIINLLHYEYTKKALLKGKNVILEKPSCVHSAQMEELAALATQRKLYLFEAVTFLHTSFFKQVREALTQIGHIKLLQCNFSKYSSRYDQYRQHIVHAVFDPQLAGGTLLDMNIYNINFVVSLVGEPLQCHYFANKGFNGIDTSGIAILQYDGFVAECSAAKDSTSPGFMQIQGEDGWIKIDGSPDKLKALILHTQDKEETLSLQSPHHRMYEEFQDFVTIYNSRHYELMQSYLDTSVKVCRTAERLIQSQGDSVTQ